MHTIYELSQLNFIAIISIAAFALSGCDTYTAQQYQNNPQNTVVLQQLAKRGEKASIGYVRLAEGVEPRPTCRLAGPLDLGGSDNIANTIKDALLGEFLAGGVYNPRGSKINITITTLKANSFSGNWTI